MALVLAHRNMVGFAILHQNDTAFRLKNERANEQIEKNPYINFETIGWPNVGLVLFMLAVVKN